MLSVDDLAKPVVAPICMFWTGLDGPENCVQALLDEPDAWAGPLEIDGDGRLAPMS